MLDSLSTSTLKCFIIGPLVIIFKVNVHLPFCSVAKAPSAGHNIANVAERLETIKFLSLVTSVWCPILNP